MYNYEITFLTREDADPGVAAAITTAGGRITSEKSLGRKQLAYPITKETAAYYTTVRFMIESEAIDELTKQFNLDKNLLRFLIVSLPEAALHKPSLDAPDLAEAKELETKPDKKIKTTAKTADDDKKPAVDTKDRDKQLQEQLDKLLSDDQNETA